MKKDTVSLNDQLSGLVRQVGFVAGDDFKLISFADSYERKFELSDDTNLNELSHNLELLSIAIKYLMFDLEATRRENSYLKNLIQDQ